MTSEQRRASIDQITALPTDEERLAAYRALCAQEVREMAPVVIMCTCRDWLTCEHPYPQRLFRQSGMDFRVAGMA